MRKNTRIERLPSLAGPRMRKAAHLAFTLALSCALALPTTHAQENTRSGKAVVDTFCIACHATGVENAPKIGDNQAWSRRAAQGLSSLTLHAIEGIRKMPAHGRTGLSDLELARAVTYMVNQSGGNWVEPASAEDLYAERSGEQVVMAQCVACHKEGVDGAPKIGDLNAWAQRMNQGLGYLTRSAIRGHGGMPPRGGQSNLTDAELRAAILYMYNPAGAPVKHTASADPGVDTDPNHRSVDGVDVYLGAMPAQTLNALPEGSPERHMHGGVPQAPGIYHINVSLFDKQTRQPISDAKVEMRFVLSGRTSSAIELEPMEIGAGSYGNYVQPQPRYPYGIALRITRPGATHALRTKFEHTFE